MVSANLGFSRIGARRELKFALERYWSGEFSEAQLHAAARDLPANTLADASGRRH